MQTFCKAVLYLLFLSRVLGETKVHQEQVFLHLSWSLQWGFLPGFAISGRGNVSVGLSSCRPFPFSPESCSPAISHSSNTYCIRELSLPTLLSGHQFCFLHQPQPFGNSGGWGWMLLCKADLSGEAAGLVHHRVHTQSDFLALKDAVFKERRATRISGHFPPSSSLIKQGWLPIKKENKLLALCIGTYWKITYCLALSLTQQ